MTPQLSHAMQVARYRSYLEILKSRGLPQGLPTEEKEIEALSDFDLAALTRQLRDIARTPQGEDR